MFHSAPYVMGRIYIASQLNILQSNLVCSGCVTENLPKCTDSTMALQIGQCNEQNRISSVIFISYYTDLTEFLPGSR